MGWILYFLLALSFGAAAGAGYPYIWISGQKNQIEFLLAAPPYPPPAEHFSLAFYASTKRFANMIRITRPV